MKKFIFSKKFIILILVFLLCCFIKNQINENNKTDITSSAEQYLTTGFFNKYKLYKIDTYHLLFSDGTKAILEVQGMEYASPHKTEQYKLTMLKNSRGLWNVDKVEEISNYENNNEAY